VCFFDKFASEKSMNQYRPQLLERFFRRVELRDHLSVEEKEVLIAASADIRIYPAGSDITKQGDRPDVSRLIIEGFASRYNMTAEGGRQITAIHVAGDFVDLHSFPLKVMDHSVGAMTGVTILHFPHERLIAITERHPHLTRLLWMLTLLDGAIHRSWLVAMGRTSALSHAAHFLCEMYERLKVVDLASNLTMTLPFTQVELGDVLGLSSVHVNRVVQELRATGKITWDGRQVTILDWVGLQNVGQYDPAFLYLEKVPR
jgi:CRP-like cAMP-binding protein